MALDKPQAVPVDVHVWQIAHRDYSWHPKTSQAKGPSPLANKELGEESVMLGHWAEVGESLILYHLSHSPHLCMEGCESINN